MDTTQIKALAEALGPVIRKFVGDALAVAAEQTAGLEARIKELEGRQAPTYRGVWTAADDYAPGDTATHAGTLWFCRAATKAKPGTSSEWQLMVKQERRP